MKFQRPPVVKKTPRGDSSAEEPQAPERNYPDLSAWELYDGPWLKHTDDPEVLLYFLKSKGLVKHAITVIDGESFGMALHDNNNGCLSFLCSRSKMHGEVRDSILEAMETGPASMKIAARRRCAEAARKYLES